MIKKTTAAANSKTLAAVGRMPILLRDPLLIGVEVFMV